MNNLLKYFQFLLSQRTAQLKLSSFSADMNNELILQTGSFLYQKFKCTVVEMGTFYADRVKT